MAGRSDSQFAQVIGGQGRQNGGVDGVLTKRGLVLLKAEGAKPHPHVERGGWNRAGGHDEGAAATINRPRRTVSCTRTSRSSARVR